MTLVVCAGLLLPAPGALAAEKALPPAVAQQAAQPPSDSQLKRTVEGRMLDARAAFFADIDIDVIDGDVLLTGYVSDPQDKVRAAALVRSVPGIHTVVNEIRIGKTADMQQAARDLNTERRIKAVLHKTFNNKMPKLSWRSVGGIVYVFGHAASEWEHNRALAVIKKIDGIKSVVDHLSIIGNGPAR